MTIAERTRGIKEHPFLQHPTVRKITGYSAGSVVALIVSEAAFAVTLGWFHGGTAWASAAGFVGGAVPNYILNRRWAWRDHRGRNRQSEISLYMLVSISSFLVSWAVTQSVDDAVRHVFINRATEVGFVTLSYLAVSAVFFVLKYIIYDTLVFKKHPTSAA